LPISGSWFRASTIITVNKVQRVALVLKSFKNSFILLYSALHDSGTLVPIIRSPHSSALAAFGLSCVAVLAVFICYFKTRASRWTLFTVINFAVNLLKSHDYCTYHQVYIHKFHIDLTLLLCVYYGSHNKQRLLSYLPLAEWFCITEVESVYCAVRPESLYKTDTSSL
jgi:hypothetical protein